MSYIVAFDEVILNHKKCTVKLFTRSLEDLKDVVSHCASWAMTWPGDGTQV